MLRRARAHAQGLRLHDLLSSSPLTVLYQCIGDVKSGQLEDALRAAVPEGVAKLPNEQVAVPVSFRVKNSLASATGRPDVGAFLRATNILVGWEIRGSQLAAGGVSPIRLAGELKVLAAQRSAGGTEQQQRKQPPQRTFGALIAASLALAEKHPVAPLAGYFHGEHIPLKDLARWSQLDDMTVYGELLQQLHGVPQGLVDAVSFGDGGVSNILDQSSSGPLLGALFALGQQAPGQQASAAAAATAAS